MAVSAADVKQLRDKTGAGMMDCKRALEESGGDIDQAISYQGQALKNMPDRKKPPPFENRIEIPNTFPPKE